MDRFFNLILLALGLLALPRVLGLLLPFILGFVIYLVCRRPVRRMAGAGLGRGTASALTLLFLLALLLGLCAVIFFTAYGERYRLPQLFSRLSAIRENDSLIGAFIKTFGDQLAGAAKSLSLELIARLGHMTGALMVLLFSLLSAFFFLRDEEKLVDIILQNGGGNFLRAMKTMGQTAKNALGGYVRAQAVLMAVTFGVLSVFLVLFGIKNAVLIAFGIAFLDAIPVFGTGFVLLPWAAWQFLTGNTALGFGLAALYGACSLIRQITEPRILSSQIGLHPLLTLVGLFLGFKLLGLAGLILGPAAVLIIVSYLQKSK